MLKSFEDLRKDLSTVYPTGIQPLDSALRGGIRHELLLIGGKAGSGKTDIAVNIAISLARFLRVVFVTIELSPNQIFFRTFTSFGAHFDRANALTEQQVLQGSPLSQPIIDNVVSAFAEDSKNLIIADDTTISPATEQLLAVEGLREYISQLNEQGTKCAVVIDYVQQARCRKYDSAPGVDTLDYIAKTLATMAHSEKTPVIALTSLSNQGEPRGSSHLLHAADIYLQLDCDPAMQGRRQRPVTGHLRKNRNGVSGVDIELLYTPELHLFE